MIRRKSRDIQKIALEVWNRTLSGWNPTGPELRRAYRPHLSDSQFKMVKRYLRERAKVENLVWGYYPLTERYLIAIPDGPYGLAITRWTLEHWQEAGRSADDTAEAASRAGFVSQDFANDVHRLADDFDRRIKRLSDEFEQDGEAA